MSLSTNLFSKENSHARIPLASSLIPTLSSLSATSHPALFPNRVSPPSLPGDTAASRPASTLSSLFAWRHCRPSPSPIASLLHLCPATVPPPVHPQLSHPSLLIDTAAPPRPVPSPLASSPLPRLSPPFLPGDGPLCHNFWWKLSSCRANAAPPSDEISSVCNGFRWKPPFLVRGQCSTCKNYHLPRLRWLSVKLHLLSQSPSLSSRSLSPVGAIENPMLPLSSSLPPSRLPLPSPPRFWPPPLTSILPPSLPSIVAFSEASLTRSVSLPLSLSLLLPLAVSGWRHRKYDVASLLLPPSLTPASFLATTTDKYPATAAPPLSLSLCCFSRLWPVTSKIRCRLSLPPSLPLSRPPLLSPSRIVLLRDFNKFN